MKAQSKGASSLLGVLAESSLAVQISAISVRPFSLLRNFSSKSQVGLEYRTDDPGSNFAIVAVSGTLGW
jgi:hypothetical protein